MTRPQTMRRQLEMLSLRFQARLDSPWADRVVPWIVTAIAFLFLVGLSLSQYRSLENGTELARYTQAAWKIGSGIDPDVGVDGRHFLTQQAAVGFLPIAMVIQFFPIGPTLLVLQSAFLAAGVVPLFRIARNEAKLRVGATLTLLVAYVLYPAIHNANLANFHLETVAPAALLGAIYNGITGRWWRFGLLVAIVLGARADLSIAVMGLGILLATLGHRRAGLLTILGAAAWLLMAFAVVRSAAGDGIYPHIDAFARWGDTPWGSLWGLLTHPIDVLEILFGRESFDRVVFLLAPLLFLPMMSLRYLLPIIPLEALYLLSDIPLDQYGNPEQDMAATAFLFTAAAFALSRAGRIRGKRTLIDPRVLGAIVLTASVFFVRDSLSTPYERPWTWGGRDASDLSRLAAIDDIPEDALVRASRTLLPALSERPRLFELDTSENFARGEAAAAGVNVVILDLDAAPLWSLETVLAFSRELQRIGFDQTSAANDILVFKRTRPPA